MPDAFLRQLERRLVRPLPGLSAQARMAPTAARQSVTPDGVDCREAATLLLLYPDAAGAHGLDDLRFVLTLRPPTLRDHSGQIALPGGSVDPGETIEEAALREGEEEIGVDRARPRVLGALTRLYIPPSGFCVTTVVAHLDHAPAFRPSPDEVAAIIEPSLADLLDVERRKAKTIRAGSGYELTAPYFDLGGHVVWGATAMMLAEFVALLDELQATAS